MSTSFHLIREAAVKRVLGSAAVILLASSWTRVLAAQDPDIVCVPSVSGVNFETGAEWRVEAPGGRCVQIRLSQLDMGLRQAEIAINQYIDRSIHDIERGHIDGYSQFRDWYRARQHQREKDEATADLLKNLFGTVLKTGLNYIFPESGVFMDKLREYASRTYELAANNVGTFTAGDVNQFLDRHQTVLNAQITNFISVRDAFQHDAQAVMDAAKWEFVLTNGTGTSVEIGPELRRMLRDAGIPEPGNETARLYKERILIRQIRGVLASEDCAYAGPCSNVFGPNLDAIATSTALRFLEPQNFDRFCAAERGVNDLLRSADCRDWRRTHGG